MNLIISLLSLVVLFNHAYGMKESHQYQCTGIENESITHNNHEYITRRQAENDLWLEHQNQIEHIKYKLLVLEYLKNNCPEQLLKPVRKSTASELFEGKYSHAQAIFDIYPQEYLWYAQSVIAHQMYYNKMNRTKADTKADYYYWNSFYHHEVKPSMYDELCDTLQNVTLKTKETDQYHIHIENPVTIKTDEIVQEKLLVTSKKEKIKKAPAAEQKPQLSKKQQAALLAAEKRAEQSRIDKERNRLAEEASKKLALIAPVTNNSSSKTNQKKLSNKKPAQPTVDEDDAILNAIIAENQKKLADKKLSDITNKKPSDLDRINQAIGSIDAILAQQKNSDSIVALEISTTQNHQLLSPYIQEYQQFLEQKSLVQQDLAAAKEIARKENLKKILRAKPHERKDLKDTLEKKLSTQFNYLSEAEYDIIMTLKTYGAALAIENLPLQNFISAYHSIVTKEQDLSQTNEHLKWYLALNQDIYNAIKAHVIQLKKRLVQTELLQAGLQDPSEGLTAQEQLTIQKKLDECGQNNEAATVLNILDYLHTHDGILDISTILYEYKTKEEIYALGVLEQYDLDKAHRSMKIMYADRTIDERHLKATKVVIQYLFVMAGIHTIHQYMIDSMINGAKDMADKIQSGENVDTIINNIVPIFFNSMQCKNEMVLEPLSIDEIADITKINALVYDIFTKVAQAQRGIENNK